MELSPALLDGLWALLFAVLLGAAALWLYALNLWSAWRSPLSAAWKAAAVIAAPLIAWKGGARRLPAAFWIFAVAYGAVHLWLL